MDSAMNHRGAAEPDLAAQRAAIIIPLATAERLTHAQVDEAAAKLGLCRSFIYRLIARYRKSPGVESLLPEKRGRRKHTRFLAPEMEEVLARAIRRCLMEAAGRSSGSGEVDGNARIMAEVRKQCASVGLRAPDRRSVLRRWEAALADLQADSTPPER